MNFGAIIIGDELLSGKRQDKHLAALVRILAARGQRLAGVEYLGDDPERLTATFYGLIERASACCRAPCMREAVTPAATTPISASTPTRQV